MKKHFTIVAMALLGTAFAQTSLPIDFESTPPTFTVFGNSTYSVLANPDVSGINTSATVLGTVHGNETWAGLFFDVTNKLDFTTDTVIQIMVWAPVAGTMRLKLEDKTNGAVFWEADQAITVASQWTQLTWDLSGVGTLYDRVVLFPGWGVTSGTYYVDNIQQGYGTVTSQVALPIDFELNPPTFTVFGNSTYSIIANPDATGLNTSATVLETVHGNETWAGLFFDVTNKLDFTTDTLIQIMVWAPATGTMRMKLEDKANGAVFWEADQAITVASQWTQLTWDMSGVGTLYDRVVLFPGWGVTSGTYYVDNIEQGTASGIGMGEQNQNVLTLAPNPANDFVTISINATNANFSIVSLTGQLVANGILTEGLNALSTANLSNGIYMVRVSSDEGTSVQKLIVRH
jgi:hypothetical protein